MIVNQVRIPDSVIQDIEARMRKSSFKTAELQPLVTQAFSVPMNKMTTVTAETKMRVADRMVQKHRKAGNITLFAGAWRWKETK